MNTRKQSIAEKNEISSNRDIRNKKFMKENIPQISFYRHYTAKNCPF